MTLMRFQGLRQFLKGEDGKLWEKKIVSRGPALTDMLLQAEPLQETQGDFLQTLHHSICFAE
jgi:hypothetical protein